MRSRIIIFLIFLWPTFLPNIADTPGAAEEMQTFPPRYEVCLTLAEFSMWNNVVVTGLSETGGRMTGIELTIEKSEGGAMWILSTRDQAAFHFARAWAGEEALQRLMTTNGDSGQSVGQQPALQAIASLSEKLELAVVNPIWDEQKAVVEIERGGDGGVVLKMGKQRLRVAGSHREAFSSLIGQQVVAWGSIKTEGEIQVRRFVPRRVNTLDLVVLSHCPASVQLERDILQARQAMLEAERPEINVHYLFYRSEIPDGRTTFETLHGKEERLENVAQMMLRDHSPDQFLDYLALRALNLDAPWTSVAESAGVPPERINEIVTMLDTASSQTNDPDMIPANDPIAAEYSRVHDQMGVADGVPRIFWEGEPITILDDVPFLRAIPLAGQSYQPCQK